jgi:hypothetical protein
VARGEARVDRTIYDDAAMPSTPESNRKEPPAINTTEGDVHTRISKWSIFLRLTVAWARIVRAEGDVVLVGGREIKILSTE